MRSPTVSQGQVGVNEDDDAVEGILLMRRGENASRAIANVRAAWKDAERVLPKGMELVPLYDRTALVRNTVKTISHSVAEGIVLVVGLLLLFLFQVRSALICAAVIPFALLTAFTLLNVFQVPANLLSLGAIDFGIIIDGSIILTENVVRRLSELSKEAKVDTALVYRTIAASTAEMARPIFIATAIIMLTFLPVLSFDHVEGKLFRPLAIMMNFTLIGAVVAVTFMVPALCAFAYSKNRLPKHRQSPLLKPIQTAYERMLQSALNFPRSTMCAIIALSVLAISTLPFIGSEFLPELEEGNIWLSVTVLPTSVSLERSVQIASEIRHIIRSYPEVTNVVSHVGGPDDGTDPMGYNFIQVLVDLEPQSTWRKEVASKSALINSMEAEIEAKRPGLVLNFSQYIKDNMDEAMSGVRNGEYAVKIYGPDIDELERLSGLVSAMLKTIPGFCDIARDHLAGQPQIAVKIDFDKAARYGISAQDVLDVVETAIGGKPVTKIIDGERRFDVILRLEKEYRSSPAEIGNILLTTPSGVRIPLAQVATVTCEQGASNITREENRRRTAVYAQIRGRDLGSTVLAAQKMVSEKLVLPPGYRVKYAGQFERAIEAGKRLCVFVPITLCMIFILLYAAFSSASLAAVVLSVVPIATGAGIVILLISGVHLSISSGVGFIALFGLCIQNAVILTARMKELTELGLAPRMAAFRGASDKLQAVVTASSVAVIGLVPAAIATGIGSQSQKPFALVIAGGLLPATALLLLAVPICYAFAVGRNKTIKLEETPKQAESVS